MEPHELQSKKRKGHLILLKGYMYTAYMYALELLYIFYK